MEKSMLLDSMNSWKASSAFCWVAEALSLQKVVKTLEEVVAGWQEVSWIWQMRQNFVAQFIQLLKCWVCVTCKWVLAWRIGPLCWPVPAAGIALFSASHQFAEHTSQMWWFCWDSESYSGLDRQQTTKEWPWPLFWCKFGFGKCFGASSQSNHWAGCSQLSHKIYFSSHITFSQEIFRRCIE